MEKAPCSIKNVLSVNAITPRLPKNRTVGRTLEAGIGSTVAGDWQDFEFAALVALETQEERMKIILPIGIFVGMGQQAEFQNPGGEGDKHRASGLALAAGIGPLEFIGRTVVVGGMDGEFIGDGRAGKFV